MERNNRTCTGNKRKRRKDEKDRVCVCVCVYVLCEKESEKGESGVRGLLPGYPHTQTH